LRLAGALGRYWEVRNYLKEGLEYLAALLAPADGTKRDAVRARALGAAGRLSWCKDHNQAAREYYREAIALYDELGQARESAYLNVFLGFVEWSEGDVTSALPRFQGGVELGRKLDDPRLLGSGLSGMGTVASSVGDHAHARELKEESLAIFGALGDRWTVGLVTWSLSRVLILQQDYEAARVRLSECVAISEELGNEWSIPYLLEGFGEIALAEKRSPRATRLYGAASVLRERLGLTVTPAERPPHEDALKKMHTSLPDAAFTQEWEAGRALSIDEALRLAVRDLDADSPTRSS
jgi:tetratricopeptide (TPR) repeat protein